MPLCVVAGSNRPGDQLRNPPKCVTFANLWLSTYRKLNSIEMDFHKGTAWPFFIAGLNRNW